MMTALKIEDLKIGQAYDSIERRRHQARIIELKKKRRVMLGPLMTVCFENYETVRWQIQEILRCENIQSVPAIQEEIESYAFLLPSSNDTSVIWVATLMIEVVDPQERAQKLYELFGVDKTIKLKIGDTLITGQPLQVSEDHEMLHKAPSVSFLKFEVPLEIKNASGFVSNDMWEMQTTHPQYRHNVMLSHEMVQSLRNDL